MEHHSFDEYLGGGNISGEFELTQKTFLRQWPGEPGESFRGSFAAQSPASNYFVICEGGGAEGSPGFLALGSRSPFFLVRAARSVYGVLRADCADCCVVLVRLLGR